MVNGMPESCNETAWDQDDEAIGESCSMMIEVNAAVDLNVNSAWAIVCAGQGVEQQQQLAERQNREALPGGCCVS